MACPRKHRRLLQQRDRQICFAVTDLRALEFHVFTVNRLNLLDLSSEHLLAGEPCALADFLDSPGLKPAKKVTNFRQFITFWQQGIEAFSAAAEEEKQNGSW
jgi:hypothetical protein